MTHDILKKLALVGKDLDDYSLDTVKMFCVIAVSLTNLEGTAALIFLGLVIVLTLRLLRNLGFFQIG